MRTQQGISSSSLLLLPWLRNKGAGESWADSIKTPHYPALVTCRTYLVFLEKAKQLAGFSRGVCEEEEEDWLVS